MALFLDSIDNCRTLRTEPEQAAVTRDRMQFLRERNENVRAFVHIADEPAQDASVRSHDAALLRGVPLAVKDLIDVAGMPTRLGCRAVNLQPQQHASVIANLIREGAVIAGKSHTTEFAMSGWGVSPLGRPLNPIDASDAFFSGGSSNGSACAVAAGLVPAALGTDTGGSVRIPSSWCGITGLKGSPGWVSTEGVAALSQRFDVVGPMARTAADVRVLYQAMLPAARRHSLERGLEQAAQQPVPTLVFLDDASLPEADADMMASYRDSQARCEALGFPTCVTSIPVSFAQMSQTWVGISGTEGYLNNRQWVDDPDAPLDDAVRESLMQSGRTDLSTYFSLLNRAAQYREQIESLLPVGRVLVLPTTSTPAVRLTQFDPQRALGIYTRFVNLIQGCAIAVPNGITQDRRPTSMQFVAAYGQDAAILHAAIQWQTHTDWHAQVLQQHQLQMQQ